MHIRRRQFVALGAWSALPLVSSCAEVPAEQLPSGASLSLTLNLVMRTPADTERPVVPLTPVFAGDSLAFTVSGPQPLHLGLVDRLEDAPRVVDTATLAAGQARRLPAEPRRWIELSNRDPRALIAVVGTGAPASREQLLAHAQSDREGWDAFPIAFDPAYATDGPSAQPATQGLPRRRFILRGRRLVRDDAAGVRVVVPASLGAVVAVLSVEHR